MPTGICPVKNYIGFLLLHHWLAIVGFSSFYFPIQPIFSSNNHANKEQLSVEFLKFSGLPVFPAREFTNSNAW